MRFGRRGASIVVAGLSAVALAARVASGAFQTDPNGVGATIASLVDDGTGQFTADVQTTNPGGGPLAGTIVVHDLHDVSGIRLSWLATSCATPQDMLDFMVNDHVVASVLPEPTPLCTCTPQIRSFQLPLAAALAFLTPGTNVLGLHKGTGFPDQSQTFLAWAYAVITVNGTDQTVPLYDATGSNSFVGRNVCFTASTADEVLGEGNTPALPDPVVAMSWQDALPCGVDLSGAAMGGFGVLVTATDGTSLGADAKTGTLSMPSLLDFANACDDGDPCTVDTCGANGCEHQPVDCGGGSSCNDGGTCDPATGQCVSAPKPDGMPCDDGNACTTGDSCQAGACVGGSPVVCGAGDACHEAGVCDPATGQCTNAPKPNGSSCDDGNACTAGDSCQAGACKAGAPVVCGGGDACHDAGVCDPATGACMNAAKADGTPCNDGNGCTLGDSCRAGVCTGGAPVVCGGGDACHDPGVCDPASGQCVSAPKPDGFPCDDGNGCTQGDSCQAGVCASGAPVVCAAGDGCSDAGTCDPATGQCVGGAPKPNGTPCDDGDLCTRVDLCQAGVCKGFAPVQCGRGDACHEPGVCDSSTGQCARANRPDGTPCSDGNLCTQHDTCEGGACTGADPVVCVAPDDCHVSMCRPRSGKCKVRRKKPFDHCRAPKDNKGKRGNNR